MLTRIPVQNSTAVMTAAEIRHFVHRGIGAALMTYMQVKQAPPHSSIVQCVQPRQIISTRPYRPAPRI